MSDIVKELKNADDTIEYVSNLNVENLESIIKYTADKYYNFKKPVISDTIYDILIDFLKMKSPKSEVLKTVGANKITTKNKVKLDYYLGSMDKIKPTQLSQLNNWMKKYPPPYNLSDKLDGISALVIYNMDKITMMTRGTATEGTDITNLIKYLNLPSYETVQKYCMKNKIKGITNMIAFRGELLIKEKVFQEQFSDKLKNGRNSVAGLVNSKTINPMLASATDLVLYEVVDPFIPIEKQFEIISDIGFKSAYNININKELTFEYLSTQLKNRRNKSEYNIDGIIVTSAKNNSRNMDGNPEYAFAFKDILEDQMSKTTVESIEWNISKDGYIKPTLILKPVTIGGVVIKRATGNNAKFIVDNILGPGAMIDIIRSGDVIPKVMKVTKVATSGKPELPKGKWHWNDTKVDIIIDDTDNDDMLVKNLYYFFSKLDTKGLGEGNIIKMIASGYDSIKKILEADIDDFKEVDGFGDKTAENLVASIKEAVTNIPLYKLMTASNKLGHGIGIERIKQIVTLYPNIIVDYKKWTKKEFINNIIEIDGWEEKTSTLFVNNFGEYIKFHDSIKKYITIASETKKTKKGEFTDKTIVFSSFRDSELKSAVENMGGKIGTSVSKNTDYLVIKDSSALDEPSDKIKKALELGIKILTKDKMMKML